MLVSGTIFRLQVTFKAWQLAGDSSEGLELLGHQLSLLNAALSLTFELFLAGADWVAVLGRLFRGGRGGRKGSSSTPLIRLPSPPRRPPRIPEDAAGRALKLPRLDREGAAGGGYCGSPGCALSSLEPTLDPMAKGEGEIEGGGGRAGKGT